MARNMIAALVVRGGGIEAVPAEEKPFIRPPKP